MGTAHSELMTRQLHLEAVDKLTRVIELSSLANAQTTGANDKNLLDIDETAAGLDSTAGEVRLSSRGLLSGETVQGAGEGTELLGASRGDLLTQSGNRTNGLGGEGAHECRASLSKATLAQHGGGLPTSSSKNHCALPLEREMRVQLLVERCVEDESTLFPGIFLFFPHGFANWSVALTVCSTQEELAWQFEGLGGRIELFGGIPSRKKCN